jgi:autotransporter-associated beta strand protein
LSQTPVFYRENLLFCLARHHHAAKLLSANLTEKSMKPKSTLRFFLLGYALLATTNAFADSAAWNVDADGNWADDGNWTPAAPGATSGTAGTDVATFGTAISAARAITVDANRNIGGIDFAGNSSAYNLSGGSILLTNGGTIQTSGGGSGHTDTIATPIEIQGDGGAASFTAGSSTNTRLLAITGGVTGVSTGTNVTTLTLSGNVTGNNTVQGGIADGAGGGKLAVVKDGTGSWNFSAADNSYSGGTTINAGTLTISTNGRLGDSAGGITFGGNAKLLVSANNVTLAATRTVTVNSGVAVMGDNNINNNPVNFTIDGPITGDGGIQVGHYQLGSGITNLNNTGNNFVGPLILGTSTDHSYSYSTFTLNIASLADGVGHGNIIFGRGNGSAANTATFAWSDSAISALTLGTRRIELDTTVETSVLANNSTNTARTITVNTDLLVSRAGDKVFGLGGSNTGTNTFNTVITDSVSPAAVISFTKSGAGRWILTQPNSYSGTTTVSGGVLVLNDANSLPGGIGITGGTSNLTLNGGTVGLATGDFTRALGTGADQVQFTGGNSGFSAYGAARTVTINNDSNFELVWGDPAFNPGALALNVGGGVNNTVTLTNPIDLNGANRTIQTSTNTAIVTSVIRNGSGTAAGLTKTGSGTLSLTNANTYDGATTASGGVLKLDNATAIPGGVAATGGTSNLTISGGGVVGLTAASGDFLRARGTGVAQVRWTGGGGFAAYDGDRRVNLGGAGATAQWNSSSFVPAGQSLVLSASNSDGTVIWENPINFAGSVRTIQVNNGSAAVDARFTATFGISGGANGGLNKTGTGTLETTATNLYTGTTTVTSGTLRLGASNVLPNASVITIDAATLDVGAGFTDSTGTLDVSAAATINLGDGGSKLAFADSKAVDWTGGSLNITGTFVPGDGVDPGIGSNPGSLRFGTDNTGLTAEQLLAISASGWSNFGLDAFGYLTATSGGVTFADWRNANGAGSQTLADDHDNDGVDNGTEFFLGGTANTTGFTELPGVDNNAGTLSVTWTKAATYPGVYGTDYTVETSATLADPWTPESEGVNVAINGDDVTYTFPNPLGTKRFARLKVTGP